jgi:anti-anti-sigma regulatory factor
LSHEINAVDRLERAGLSAGAWHTPEHPDGPRRGGSGAPNAEPRALVAPVRLVSETREEFRRAALRLIEQRAQERREALDIDLRRTTELDAGGLGILVLIQRRARTHGLATRLICSQDPVRRLLALTKLDYLFEFVD